MQVISSSESSLEYPDGNDQITENYWRILDINLAWIRQSDTKAYTIFMIYGISISLAFSNAEAISLLVKDSVVILLLVIIYLMSSRVAIFFGFRCLQPSLRLKFPSSIIFFGSVARRHKSPDEYYEHSKTIVSNPESVHRELCNQIYINSVIAKGKFDDIYKSISAFLVSLITLLLIIMKYFI